MTNQSHNSQTGVSLVETVTCDWGSETGLVFKPKQLLFPIRWHAEQADDYAIDWRIASWRGQKGLESARLWSQLGSPCPRIQSQMAFASHPHTSGATQSRNMHTVFRFLDSMQHLHGFHELYLLGKASCMHHTGSPPARCCKTPHNLFLRVISRMGYIPESIICSARRKTPTLTWEVTNASLIFTWDRPRPCPVRNKYAWLGSEGLCWGTCLDAYACRWWKDMAAYSSISSGWNACSWSWIGHGMQWEYTKTKSISQGLIPNRHQATLISGGFAAIWHTSSIICNCTYRWYLSRMFSKEMLENKADASD